MQRPDLFPGPFREVVGVQGNLGPHAFQFPVRDRDQLRLEQEAGGGVGREHALGVAQKPRAIGIVGSFRNLLARLKSVQDAGS